MRLLLSALFAVALPVAAHAACPGETQLEMNDCAQAEYEAADADLNAVWAPVKAHFDSFGQGEALLDAQRKWITYRDAACQAEIAPYGGGSIRPLVYSDCMTRLTRRRTEDLRGLQSM